MSSTLDLAGNPRVLSLHDPEVARRELTQLGAPPQRIAHLLGHWPCLVTVLVDVPVAAAQTVIRVFVQLGGDALTDGGEEGTGTVILAGNTGQYHALAERVVEGEPAAFASSVVTALHHYGAQRDPMQVGGASFAWGSRTYVMGILNVTPDSFSGDGLGDDVGAAIAQAQRFVAEGADIIDVGGESTRPHSERIDVEEELRRVLPVVERLSRELSVPVSIDTSKAAVAERCLDAGAALVNDIWGLRADAAMADLVARRGVPVILMHNQHGITYRNLMRELIGTLRQSLRLARGAGVPDERIIVDPGIGFGKTKEQNLEVLHRLEELKVLGKPLLLGTSRKSTIGFVLNLPSAQRMEGTAATVALGIAQGADLVRVHDVREMVRVCRMADAVVRWQPAGDETQHWLGQTG